MEHGLQIQEDAAENEGEKTVDGGGLSFSTSREEMIHHLEEVDEFVIFIVTFLNDRDNLDYLQKVVGESYSWCNGIWSQFKGPLLKWYSGAGIKIMDHLNS